MAPHVYILNFPKIKEPEEIEQEVGTNKHLSKRTPDIVLSNKWANHEKYVWGSIFLSTVMEDGV